MHPHLELIDVPAAGQSLRPAARFPRPVAAAGRPAGRRRSRDTPQQPGGFPTRRRPAPQPGYPAAAAWFPPIRAAGSAVRYPNLAGGPPPAKKSNVGKIILIVLAVVLVLCLGGARHHRLVPRTTSSEVVDASKTRVVRAGYPRPAGRSSPTRQLQSGRRRRRSREMKTSARNETSTAGAFYGDPAKQDLHR